MKTTLESAAEKSILAREKLAEELGEQLGKETEENLGAIKWSLKKTEIKNFEQAQEVRNFPSQKVEVMNISGKKMSRSILQPGWKKENCQHSHFHYLVTGVLKVKMDNGEEYELRSGDVSMLSPGHDAWVVGDDPVVLVDFQELDPSFSH